MYTVTIELSYLLICVTGYQRMRSVDMLSGSESSCRTPEMWADEDEDVEVDDAVSDISCDKSGNGKLASQGKVGLG